MKSKFYLTISFLVILIVVSLLSSCKKTEIYDDAGPKVPGDIFYEQKAVGSNVSEPRAVNIDGANDRKIDIILPEGWEITQGHKVMDGPYLMAVTAYNARLQRQAIFSNMNGNTDFRELPRIAGANNINLHGFILGSWTTALLYNTVSSNSVIQFWTSGVNLSIQKLDFNTPPITGFVAGQILVTSHESERIAFISRSEDAVGNQNTYSIYASNFDGSGRSVVTTGQAGEVLAVEGINKVGDVLYSKIKSGGLTELWLIKINGANNRKINFTLPAGQFIKSKGMAKIDDRRIAFLTTTSADNAASAVETLYTADLAGADIKLIKGFAAGISVSINSYVKYWYY